MNQVVMPVVGIDVSKKKLDVALLAHGKLKHKVVENTKTGYADLVVWLGKQNVVAQDVHACMESTGVYSEPAALGLQSLGLKVSMVNPTRIKGLVRVRASATRMTAPMLV